MQYEDNTSVDTAQQSIVPFDFQGRPIRVISDSVGEPWFIAADVCKILELDNVSRAVASLEEEDKGVTTSNTLGGEQQVTTVSEAGLYDLVFKSRKPEAKAFKRWVMREVLPSIRKTGSYSISKTGDHRLDALEMLRQNVLAIIDIEKQQAETERRVKLLEESVSDLSAEENFFTVMGYYALRGQKAPREAMAQIGKRAVALSMTLGMPVGKRTHPIYGVVNTYHEEVLRQVLGW